MFVDSTSKSLEYSGDSVTRCHLVMMKDCNILPHCDPRREAGDSNVSPPVWNLRAVSLIPLLYSSSHVRLPSPVALSVLAFSAFGPFS